MTKPTRLLAVIATASVALLILAACGGGGGEAVEAPERRDAPPFGGSDPVTGEAHSLADFAGKPVVVSFWASWCGPCKDELPELQAFADKHPEAQVLGINFQDTPSGARDIQEEIGFSFPSVTDESGELGVEFGLIGMPTTFFLDAEHRIAGQLAGGGDLEQFEEGLRLAVEG